MFLLLITTIHLTSLLLYCADPERSVSLRVKTTVPACALQLASALALLLRYSTRRRRSHLLELFLLLFVVADSFRTHTLWSLASQQQHYTATTLAISVLQTVATSIYLIFLVVLSWPTRRPLNSEEAAPAGPKALVPSEADCCLLSLLFLHWLNPMLSYGRGHTISQRNMETLEVHPSSAFLSLPAGRPDLAEQWQPLWLEVVRNMPLRTHLAYLGVLILDILQAATTLCQPLIISGLVEFLQGDQDTSAGAWLVVALILE